MGGGPKSSFSSSAARRDEEAARIRAERDQTRWQSEQAQIEQQRQSMYNQREDELKASQEMQTQQAQRAAEINQQQQQGIAATGGASGIKAANTAISAPHLMQEKAAGAGIGLGSLANLLKKRQASQSNFVGTGNSLTPGSVSLGG
jgi:hypothetical protein